MELVMKKLTVYSLPSLVLCLLASLCTTAQTVPATVTGVNDQPLRGVEFTVSGNGGTTGPTDAFGKTQILLPAGTQVGDLVVLVLKPATKPPTYMFFSPWEGRAVVPKSPGYVAIVLGTQGNRAALANPKVLSALVSAINQKNDRVRNAADFPAYASKNLGTVADATGFKPQELDKAIKGFLANTDDPTLRNLRRAYLADYPRPLPASMGIAKIQQPELDKKQF
jgi:hypothetical protein